MPRALVRALPVIGVAVVVAAMFWRLWTPIAGAQKVLAWDALWQYWGDLGFQIDAYADGELPLWNPYDRAGYPAHADPQVGVLYPVNWLLVGVGLVAGPGQWLIAVKACLHFAILGLGMFVLVRRHTRSAPIAAAAAAIVLFTHPTNTYLFSALIWGIAWLPWIIVAIEAWLERPGVRTAAGVALAAGMCVLAGAPASTWYALLVVGPFAVWAAAVRIRAVTGADRRALVIALAKTGGIAIGLLLAMVAAQLVATSGFVEHTVRATRDLAFIGNPSIGGDELIGMAIPRAPTDPVLYLGTATVLWVGVAMTTQLSVRNLVLAGIAVFGVFLAWGAQGPFLPTLASTAPGFDLFRSPHRYFFVVTPALALLAADGLGALAKDRAADDARRLARMVLVFGTLAATVLAIGFVVAATQPKTEAYRDAFAIGAVGFAAATWISHTLVARPAWRRAAIAIAAVALIADLWFARHPIMELNFCDPNAREVTSNRHCPFPTTPQDREVRALPGVPREARVYDKAYVKYRPGTRLGIRDLGGYEGDPLALRRYESLRAAAVAAPGILGHANVRYLLEGGRDVLRKGAGDTAKMRELKKGVWELAEVAPAVMWTDRVQVVAGDHDAALAALRATTPGTTAVLEKRTLDAATAQRIAALGAGGGAAPVAGRLVGFGRNAIAAEVTAPADGVVVIHEAYFARGWSATVDGADAAIVPVNAAFRGILVGPGAHRIELRYTPTGYLVLAALSILGVLGTFVLWIVLGRRQAAAARATPAPTTAASA
jgi:hypothetical protein